MTSAQEALEHLREGNSRFALNMRNVRYQGIQIQHDGLLVVGAEYSLETGMVEFFEPGKPA